MDVPPKPTLDVPVTATPDTPVNVITPAPADVTLPYNDMEEGAAATIPPLKAYALPLPRVRVPVFKKVAALVMVAPPENARLYPVPAVVNVPAVTEPANVPVEQLVTVTVPIPVPTAPTLNVPRVFIVRSELPAVVPVTLVTDIAPDDPPVPKVRFAPPAFKVVAPSVIAPVPAVSWLEPVMVVVLYKFIG